MRTRLFAVLAALFLVLLTAPGASAKGDQSLQGWVRGPDQQPISHVLVKVLDDSGALVGKDRTDKTGEWQVALPSGGTYTAQLVTGTLPKGLQLRNEGGETLEGLGVSPGEDKTVLFPLIPAGQSQESATGSSPDAGEGTTAGEQTEAGASSSPGSATSEAALSGKSKWAQAVQLTVDGIKFGAIIAITAVGLSLVFGTTRLINFAHGELVSIGAVVAFWFSASPGNLPLALAAVLAIIAGALVGGAMEGVLWRPLRKRGAGLIQMFIISIGVSLLLRHLILIFFGSRRQSYDQYTVQHAMDWGPISITPRDLTVTLISIAILLGVAFALQRTRIGKATRAVADNRALAESSGIDVNRVILIVWIAGGGLAGLGGVFFGLVQQAVYWNMGFNLLLLMFAGVILGGLGSAYGAMIGSLVVGLVAQLSTLWFSIDLQYAWALLALIVVLIVRPQGILGRAERAG